MALTPHCSLACPVLLNPASPNLSFPANFALPEEEAEATVPTFLEITFVELQRKEAAEVVEQYNKVAKEKGFGKKHEERKTKKFRGASSQPRGSFRGRGAPFIP